VGCHERIKNGVVVLLVSFDDELEVARKTIPLGEDRAERLQIQQDLGLVVRDAPPVEPVALQPALERVAPPLAQVSGGLAGR
jgi:hypothetical protein